MLNPGKLNEMRKLAQNPADSEYVEALVTALVELEHRQLEAVEALHDAQGIDGVTVTTTREERKDALLEMGEAAANGNLKRYWFENVVGQHVENWEDALPYAGLDAEEWHQQMESWADLYRAEDPETYGDLEAREIADRHVRSKFSVGLDEFEGEVVDYSRQDVLQTALASNFQSVETGIRASEAVARGNRERADDALPDDELQPTSPEPAADSAGEQA